jgi:predicted ferric reductase
MSKDRDGLVTLICWLILIPIVIEFVFGVVTFGVIFALEFADQIGEWFSHVGVVLSVAGFALLGWLFIRARRAPIP